MIKRDRGKSKKERVKRKIEIKRQRKKDTKILRY